MKYRLYFIVCLSRSAHFNLTLNGILMEASVISRLMFRRRFAHRIARNADLTAGRTRINRLMILAIYFFY